MVFITGDLVDEVHMQWSDWLSQVVRYYKEDTYHVEMEWLAGPIPIELVKLYHMFENMHFVSQIHIYSASIVSSLVGSDYQHTLVADRLVTSDSLGVFKYHVNYNTLLVKTSYMELTDIDPTLVCIWLLSSRRLHLTGCYLPLDSI
jgi:hypothetical protein